MVSFEFLVFLYSLFMICLDGKADIERDRQTRRWLAVEEGILWRENGEFGQSAWAFSHIGASVWEAPISLMKGFLLLIF